MTDWTEKGYEDFTIAEALELSDSFHDDCKNGIPIPAWARALRALAAWVIRERDYQARQFEGD
jgi:hypothetical protein